MDHAEDSALTSADNKLCPALHKACALGIVARGSQLPFTTLWRIRRRKTDSLEQKRTKQKQKTMNESSQHHLLKNTKTTATKTSSTGRRGAVAVATYFTVHSPNRVCLL